MAFRNSRRYSVELYQCAIIVNDLDECIASPSGFHLETDVGISPGRGLDNRDNAPPA